MALRVDTCHAPGCTEKTTHTYFVCTGHLKEIYGLEIRQAAEKGLGLFALKPFRKGERISQFGGELISAEELRRRYDRVFDPLWDTAPYAMAIRGRHDLVRDEMRARSPAAYANDSIDARALYVRVLKGEFWATAYRIEATERRANSRVNARHQLKAMRDIEAGEEITWNYGNSYWQGKNVIDAVLCP
jgi:SET domain-containing protein